MEYYSAIKHSEILPFVTALMDLQGIMLSEISQRNKNSICSHLYVESNEQNKLMNKIQTEAWIHGAVEQCKWVGRGGSGWEKMKGLDKEHVCLTHRHRQQCGDGQRDRGRGSGRKEQRGTMWGYLCICNSVNNKNLKKKQNFKKDLSNELTFDPWQLKTEVCCLCSHPQTPPKHFG